MVGNQKRERRRNGEISVERVGGNRKGAKRRLFMPEDGAAYFAEQRTRRERDRKKRKHRLAKANHNKANTDRPKADESPAVS